MSWKEEFGEVCTKTHTEQGIWWLNGFWKDGAEEYKEDIWTTVHQFIECQLGRKKLYGSKVEEFKEDADLGELESHRILELMGETLTVVALRKRLKELDLDSNKRMAISEYLLDKYKQKPQTLVDAPQGEVDPAKLAAAQAACDAAGAALDEAARNVEISTKAKAEAEAALAAAEEAEAQVKAAEAVLQAAIAEIEALEEAKRAKIAKCQAIIDDPSAGVVKKGRAVSEKEQVLAEDPLPLRKAKITQKAALRKVEKARKKAEEETAKSAAASAAAAQAKEEADAAKKAADEAVAEATRQLDALKKKGGVPLGKIWWMERTMEEKKKYMR